MAIWDKFKKKSGPKHTPDIPAKPKTPKTPKEIATEKGEPWVSVLSVDVDIDNPGDGAFELDWNDKFLSNLIRVGYKGKDDNAIVDLWFQDVCKNVIQENYEQMQADPDFRSWERDQKKKE